MDLKCYLLYLNQITHKYYVKKPLQNVMDTLANVISKNTSIVFTAIQPMPPGTASAWGI